MSIFYIIFIFTLGLGVGSFITAYSYRWPRGISVKKGRSFCPHCKKKISWYDNIPLISYLLLGGKCRNCGEKISIRYPLIEFLTAVTFISVYYFLSSCTKLQSSPICEWQSVLGWWALPYLLTLASILLAIFVIDFEHQLIPDELVFFLINISVFALIIATNDKLYLFLLSGFGMALFLLLLNLITKGRGMGLGDVKLVIPLGLILGWPYSLVWLFVSFISGGVVGLILIALKRARFGKHIAFGPFMILAFLITMFWGDSLVSFLLPWLS